MARTNKYTSLNFNDIYDKKPTSSSSIPSTNKTVITNSRIHGNMLVLTRPSPKPITPPTTTQPPVQPDSISLRPLGRTGSPSPSLLPLSDLTVSVTPRTNNNNNNNSKFVPPHLRPGFHGKEERPEPEVYKQTGFGTRQNPNLGSTVNRVEEGRPKSGSGYEMNRPRSSGSNRPFSSG